MIDRERFVWDCVIQPVTDQGPVGDPVEYEFSAFWSPARDFVTSEKIALSAAAEAFITSGRSRRFIPISAQLREAA